MKNILDDVPEELIRTYLLIVGFILGALIF